jgi:sigma-B regulation protein RsbU (phosphoserine phosphatase)
VGGDFYDMWPIGSDGFAIAIGDAAGTGPEAAVLTARVRHTLRALTISETEPGVVVWTLNRALFESGDDVEGERFCTAIYGVVTAGDVVEVRLGSGGHPSPIVRRRDGSMEVVRLRGTLLGVFADTVVETATVRLGPGDTLVLFTDGVLEAKKEGVPFEEEGVMAVLATRADSALAVANALERAVLEHTGGSLNDDMAAVVLRVRED